MNTTSRARNCQLICDAFCVCCPHCGESLPNPDGSLMWTASDFIKRPGVEGVRPCPSCNASVRVISRPTARIE